MFLALIKKVKERPENKHVEEGKRMTPQLKCTHNTHVRVCAETGRLTKSWTPSFPAALVKGQTRSSQASLRIQKSKAGLRSAKKSVFLWLRRAVPPATQGGGPTAPVGPGLSPPATSLPWLPESPCTPARKWVPRS